MRRRIVPEGADEQGRPWSELRWSRFKELGEAASMYRVVGDRVFPFLGRLGGEESAYATHMRDARFTIPTPGLLTKVVQLLDAVPMEDRDTKGDIYQYMLSKLATAGTGPSATEDQGVVEALGSGGQAAVWLTLLLCFQQPPGHIVGDLQGFRHRAALGHQALNVIRSCQIATFRNPINRQHHA